MSNSKWKDKVVIITGGSSGIGYSLARLFACEGAKLYLIARDNEKLQRVVTRLKEETGQSNLILPITADVSDYSRITEVVSSIAQRSKSLDLLINNAGLMRCGKFDSIGIDDFLLSMQVNYMGAYYATRAAWKYLSNARGHVAFVGSVAGYIGLIGYSVYSPSKFAITGLAECLRMEGERDGVNVSIIYPGDTQTPLLEEEHRQALPETIAINKGVKIRTPDEVAAIFKQGIESRKFEIYCDAQSKFYRQLRTILPGLFFDAIDRTARKVRQNIL
jgi:3-dehydrosphinganine reductase